MEVDEERALHWLRVGAQPSQAVQVILTKLGIWERFQAERGRGGAPKASAGAAKASGPAGAGGGEEGPAAP
jgi:hypothetical protein